MTKALEQTIRELAEGRCEYCLWPEVYSQLSFVLDHIVAKQHGGATVQENLALCCPWCNRHKGPNIASVDPLTQASVFLFHPRNQNWIEHFQLTGVEIHGLTVIGRATVALLKMNHPTQRTVRTLLIREGRFREK